MKSFLKNSSFQLKTGILLLLLIFIFAFILPIFGKEDPKGWNTYISYLKPSAKHLLGTTAMGQDIFLLLAVSIRNSLFIGLIVAVLSTIFGIFMGLIAALRGGAADRIISLLTDVFITIPSLPILILLASMYKGRASVFTIAGILTVFTWPWTARQVRSMALSLRERDFINTARFSGNSQYKILTKELLPFVLGWSGAKFIHALLAAIRSESSLAIIGLSNNSWATLGTMIFWANNYQAMLQGKWIWIGAPVVATVVLFVALFMTMSGIQKYNAMRRGKEA